MTDADGVADLGTIAVLLDGTLAEEDPRGGAFIGAAISPMVNRVRRWLRSGRRVVVLTARAAEPAPGSAARIWCQTVLGPRVTVTNRLPADVAEIWGGRCVATVPGRGTPVAGPCWA